jgi:hypothetical protein
MDSEKITVELVRLSKEKPTPHDCGLFGEVLAICALKENTELCFRDLMPDEIERINQTNQAENWYWIRGLRDECARVILEKTTQAARVPSGRKRTQRGTVGK